LRCSIHIALHGSFQRGNAALKCVQSVSIMPNRWPGAIVQQRGQHSEECQVSAQPGRG